MLSHFLANFKDLPMGKKLSLFLAIFFLFALIAWLTLLKPILLSLPKDFSFTAHIVSIDNLYDEKTASYRGPVYSQTEYSYDTVGISGDALLIKNLFSVKSSTEGHIFSVERIYGINRKTGEHIPGLGDKEREGFLFAPRHVGTKDTFTFWHPNYDGPARMRYVGTETLYRLKVRRFETRYEGIFVDQTQNLGHIAGVGKTRGIKVEPHLEVWIEPETGRLIKYKDRATAYFYDLKTGKTLSPWNSFSNTFDESSVKETVIAVRSHKMQERFIEWYVPIMLIILFCYFFASALTGRHILRTIVRHRLFFIFIIAVIIVGAALPLLGWLTDIPSLTFLLTNASAMNPVTALCFLLLGIGLFLDDRLARYLRTFIGILIVAVAALRMLNAVGAISFSVDLTLFSDAILAHPMPARMGIYTALSFLMLGTVFLSERFRLLQKIHIAEIVSLISIFFAALLLVGFTLDAFSLTEIPLFFSIPIHTAVLFLCTGIAAYIRYHNRGPYVLPFDGWAKVTGMLCVMVLMTVLVTGVIERIISRQTQDAFDTEASRIADAVENRLLVYINTLKGAEGLLAVTEAIDRAKWRSYIHSINLEETYPGIQGIGYSVFVRGADRERHIQAVRAEGFPRYTIHPEGRRDLYSAILFIEPFTAENQRAFGFDMFQEPVRQAAMVQARDTGEPRISGRVTLVQETERDAQQGFLIYIPIYRKNALTHTLAQRQAAIIGYVYSPFRAAHFIEGTLGISALPNIALRIYDGIEQEASRLLYSKEVVPSPHLTERPLETIKTIYVAGRPWTLVFTASPEFGGHIFSRLASIIVVMVGIALSILLTTIFFILISSRQKAENYAESVTRDLTKSRDDLAQSNKAIQEKLDEVERLNKLMVGRELRMIELKETIKKLVSRKQ